MLAISWVNEGERQEMRSSNPAAVAAHTTRPQSEINDPPRIDKWVKRPDSEFTVIAPRFYIITLVPGRKGVNGGRRSPSGNAKPASSVIWHNNPGTMIEILSGIRRSFTGPDDISPLSWLANESCCSTHTGSDTCRTGERGAPVWDGDDEK